MSNTILTGPLLTGRGPEVIADIGGLVQEQIAGFAFERVHELLDINIVDPTPYYETQILQQRIGTDEVVHDRGIVYGPWLEGTSTRNRTTRFKGYASFRGAMEEAQHRAPAIAEETIAANLNRLGG